MSDAVVSFLLNEVKDLVKDALADGNLSSSEILKIAMEVVKKASSAVDLAFEEKKKLVVKVVETSLKSHLAPEQFEQTGARVALEMLPTVLDIAMKAASGHFDLTEKVVEKAGWNCLSSCFSFVKKEAPVAVDDTKKVALQLLEPVVPSGSSVSPAQAALD